jgi:molecular chaperone DnaJ
MKKDYYLILRLTPEATAEEIRSAYRRLAIELHPDLSGFGSDPFLELQEAYSVLIDPCVAQFTTVKHKKFRFGALMRLGPRKS